MGRQTVASAHSGKQLSNKKELWLCAAVCTELQHGNTERRSQPKSPLQLHSVKSLKMQESRIVVPGVGGAERDRLPRGGKENVGDAVCFELCYTACRILFPQPGIEPMSPAVEAQRVLTPDHQGTP